MRMLNILGGVASSAVIVAMAVVYSTAPREANASIPPALEIESGYTITGFSLQPPLLHQTNKATVQDYLDVIKLGSLRPRARPVPQLPDLVNRDDQQYCLAQNIYFEARGESKLGQEAVAWVTLNRVMDPARPKTICAVVWQDSQFSWTSDGLKDTPALDEAWTQAQNIATDITARWNPNIDPTQGSVMFHAARVNPDWSDNFTKIVRIDDHVFYNN